VEIGRGRALNLVCMGSGDKTVLFDAGGSDWSVVWALVQPTIARRTRACAYDRAGLGYSDPAPGPRSPSAIVQDMSALIEAAKLPRPLVLVGHSLGGFNVKLYAALHPEDVAGLVLVDAAEDRTWDRTRKLMHSRYGVPLAARVELSDHWFLSALAERYRECAAAAKTVDLDPVSLTYRRCSDPPRPQLGPKIAAARQLVQIKAAYQAAQASEIAWSAYNDREMDHVYADLFRKGALGAKPMIVLTHEENASDDPEDRLNRDQGLAVHRESAALSSRGTHRIVSGSGHYIELDRPAVVLEAINSVLNQIAAP
jgi:pimeloyl-ACP methyl ester carboxylesterase